MATKDDIITLPHVDLRKKSQRVHVITEEIKALIQDMETATLDWEKSRPYELGVALAAVQIDRLFRVVIVRNDFDDKDDHSFFTLINPEVIKTEGVPVYDHEGCLSIQDVYGLVPRFPKIRVKALDKNGQEIRFRTEGFLARVIQHEIDHTNGVLFIDHIKDQDAFFSLDKDGELEKIGYEDVKKSRILW